jgi:excisionase family DNA binding protein
MSVGPASTSEPAEFSLALSPAILDALAQRIAPRVAELLKDEVGAEQWFNSGQAADYLGMTRNALHKLTSARQIPFEQDGPGCKLYFRRSELDRWRSGGTAPK